MVSMLAHSGQPPEPHDVWTAWNLDPLLLIAFALAALAYWRGSTDARRRGVGTWRAACFAGGLIAVGIALVSPLDAMSSALASAHMVQHILLVLVAAPLLALSAPSKTILRGSPVVLRRAAARWRRRLKLTRRSLRPLYLPSTVWLLHVATLWFWHAAVPYDAALDNELLHIVEHTTFLLTGVLFWSVMIGARHAARVADGLAILLVFAMAVQSILLSALLTFARAPWYSGYAQTTTPWGLDPLADQQLAGVIMWIPAGMIYVAAGLALLVEWIHVAEREGVAVVSR